MLTLNVTDAPGDVRTVNDGVTATDTPATRDDCTTASDAFDHNCCRVTLRASDTVASMLATTPMPRLAADTSDA
jgi:hypothetical protein